MLPFALTIFTGAFLLFQVQPLIGKFILPWFGGSPGVWTTCMLFFQVLLLGGYAYAHALSRYCRPRTQVWVHLALLLAALLTLPISPDDAWKPTGAGNPTWHILTLLAATLGLPYLVVAATGPLMQEWFRRTAPDASPWRLYALSNVGSLLALVSYPFYVETAFSRQAQAVGWSWGLGLYALGCAACAWRVFQLRPAPIAATAATEAAAPRPGAGIRLLWLALPACASVLLLAVTNKMCQDVAVIPFLWVVPLALYLLTFIISFDGPRWYSRFYYTLALAAAMAAAAHALIEGADMDIRAQVAIYAVTLFVGCMVCHGELYHLRPHPRHLTEFYLCISAGGALGGLFVALVAPALFDNYYETHLSLALCVALLLVLTVRDRTALSPARWRILGVLLALLGAAGLSRLTSGGGQWLRTEFGTVRWLAAAWDFLVLRPWLPWGLVAVAGLFLIWRERRAPINWHRLTAGLLGAGLVALVTVLGLQIHSTRQGALVSGRNFYGVLSVFEYERGNPQSHHLLLQHGRITHGFQFVDDARAPMITSYFGPSSGIGRAFRELEGRKERRIAIMGLGVGTLAAYGRAGDTVRIYEINPQVVDIARRPFRYLELCPAKVELVMGDARLSMENEPPQAYDVLIMDAFSSDAVPVHLLTREAFAIYQRHLKPDGVILVNISNRYLDLRPVVENAAREFGYESLHFDSEDGMAEDLEGGWWYYAASWMVLSKDQALMNRESLRRAASAPVPPRKDIALWTDDYSSMFRILK